MSAESQLRLEQIEAAFREPLPPVRVTLLYRFAIGLVALCMLLLPLAYVGLVAVTAYAWLWHAVHNVSVFHTLRSVYGALLIYAGPLVAGGTLLLFMVKPLFAPRPPEPQRVSVTREEQPELFFLVEKLCAAIGAPMPRRIDLNCDVNASASFRRGLLSLFSDDLVLTIGLPLVSGLNLRQLTGVLAHEFGHFAQGSGMRVSYIIRSVNAWFARVVYGRDRWDMRLVEASQANDIRIGVFFYLARFFVWLTRLVLKGLMYVGHTLSCFLLRQMEFDADRYEARVAGSEIFGQTARRLPLLSVAHAGAVADVSGSWQDRQLTDDFVAVVMHNFSRLPTHTRELLEQHIAETKTKLFDTHPCDRERIEHAEAEHSAGLFRLEVPARSLFRDYAALSRRCSKALYEEQLEVVISDASLLPSEVYLAQQRERDAEFDALRAFLGRPLDPERALRLDLAHLGRPPELDADRAALQGARTRMDELRDEVLDHYAEDESRHLRWVNGLQAEALLEAGLKLDAASFGLQKADVESARRLAAAARSERLDAPQLFAFDASLTGFVTAGLRLAHAMDLPEARHIEAWVRAHQALEAERTCIDQLEAEFFRQLGLLNNFASRQHVQGLRDGILSRSRTLLAHLRALRQGLEQTPYPFEHADGDVSFGHALVPELPADADEIGQVMNAASGTLQRVQRARARNLARLLRIALAAERAFQEGADPRTQRTVQATG